MLPCYYSYLTTSYLIFDMPILYEIHLCYSLTFFYVPFVILKLVSFFKNLGNMKQKSNNFDILSFTIFPLHALEHGSGYKQSKCMKVVTKGCLSMSMCGCPLDVHLWSFVSLLSQVQMKFFFFTHFIWMSSIYLKFFTTNEAW